VIIPGAGHWLMEEARDRTVSEIAKLVDDPRPTAGTASPP
jgi:pimeloyl-ACP methyl ester carboxylesterase